MADAPRKMICGHLHVYVPCVRCKEMIWTSRINGCKATCDDCCGSDMRKMGTLGRDNHPVIGHTLVYNGKGVVGEM